MTEEACAFELVSEAATIDDALHALRRALNLAHRSAGRRGSLSSHVPPVWIVSAGIPTSLLGVFGGAPMERWPRGFYELSLPLARVRVVVVDELPVDPDTVWLRLLGRRTLDDALAELERAAYASEEYRRIASHVSIFIQHEEHPAMKPEEFAERVMARERGEAFAAGKRQLLLKQLELKFGPLPHDISSRLDSASAEDLDRWAERILTAPTLEDLLARE